MFIIVWRKIIAVSVGIIKLHRVRSMWTIAFDDPGVCQPICTVQNG